MGLSLPLWWTLRNCLLMVPLLYGAYRAYLFQDGIPALLITGLKTTQSTKPTLMTQARWHSAP